MDPSSGISSISLGELLEGVVPVDQEVCVDSETAGARREKRESELYAQHNPLIKLNITRLAFYCKLKWRLMEGIWPTIRTYFTSFDHFLRMNCEDMECSV